MEETQFLGYLVIAIITLGSFIAVIMKFTQPINDLRIVIQKLNDRIDAMKEGDDKRDQRIEKHGKQIDELDNRVGTLETKVRIYHNDKN